VFGIAAEAALSCFWEDHPAFVIYCVLLAGSGLVGCYCSADYVISSVGAVHSLTIIKRVIEKLAIDTVSCLINEESLVEVD